MTRDRSSLKVVDMDPQFFKVTLNFAMFCLVEKKSAVAHYRTEHSRQQSSEESEVHHPSILPPDAIWPKFDRLTTLMLSRVAAPPSSSATRSIAPNEAARPPGQTDAATSAPATS